eukprot:246972-Prorocentrum_minimum.AAC.1
MPRAIDTVARGTNRRAPSKPHGTTANRAATRVSHLGVLRVHIVDHRRYIYMTCGDAATLV